MEPDKVVAAIDRGLLTLDEIEREVSGVGQAWSTPMLRVIRALREPLEEIAREREDKREHMMLPTERPD